MTEQSRIITEEQWREYRQLKCLQRRWAEESEKSALLENYLREIKEDVETVLHIIGVEE